MSKRWLENFDLTQLEGRKETFQNKPEWEPAWVAAEGWYYTGYKNYVQCVACGGQLSMPLTEIELRNYHCAFFPWCEILNDRLVLQDKLENARITDTLWNSAGHVIEYPLADPKKTHMKNEVCRYCTLTEPDVKNKARVFAKAGFYAKVNKGLLQCYYCGVKVSKSELNENVILAHVRRSPECEHIKRLLGYVLVNEIRQYYGINEDERVDVTDQVPNQALARNNNVLL